MFEMHRSITNTASTAFAGRALFNEKGDLEKTCGKRQRSCTTASTVSAKKSKASETASETASDSGHAQPRRWTAEEDEQLISAIKELGESEWTEISKRVAGRSRFQCVERWQKVLQPGLKKGSWSAEEDSLLRSFVEPNLPRTIDDKLLSARLDPKCVCWKQVCGRIPNRTAKQCRERWFNHLDPSVNKGEWTAEEDLVLLKKSKAFPQKWARIASFLPGRTANMVKTRVASLRRKSKRQSRARPSGTVNTEICSAIVKTEGSAHQVTTPTAVTLDALFKHEIPVMDAMTEIPFIGNMEGFGNDGMFTNEQFLKTVMATCPPPLNVDYDSLLDSIPTSACV